MGWKEQVESTSLNVASHLIEIRHLQRQQAAMNTKLDLVVKLVQEQVTRMGDRLIEMAMVNNGMGRDAATHRRSLAEETVTPPQDLWQENPENEWPPKGFDALSMP